MVREGAKRVQYRLTRADNSSQNAEKATPMLDAYYSDDQFLQSCEVCGRPTIISLELAGQQVGCRHCGGTFIASDLSLECHLCSQAASEEASVSRADSILLRLAASFLTALGNFFGELI